MPLYRYIDIPKKTHFFCPFARRILHRGNGTGASALKTHRSVGKAQINLALLSFFRNLPSANLLIGPPFSRHSFVKLKFQSSQTELNTSLGRKSSNKFGSSLIFS